MLKLIAFCYLCNAPSTRQSCMVEKTAAPFLCRLSKTFGDDIGIAFSGAEDVALVEYAHLTGRPFRVFRWARFSFRIEAIRCSCGIRHVTL